MAYGVGRLGRDSHNAQCLPVWKQSGPMLSAGFVPMLGRAGPMVSHRAHILAQVGPMLGYHVGPMLAYVGPMLSHLGSYVGAMFGPSVLKPS